jgi:hypothetical protein
MATIRVSSLARLKYSLRSIEENTHIAAYASIALRIEARCFDYPGGSVRGRYVWD